MIPFRPHHSWWVQLLLLGWRWLTELILLGLLTAYFVKTSDAGRPMWLAVLVLVVVLVALLAWGPTRRVVAGVFWTLVTRHRLRSYFLQCGAYNRSGSLPWLTLSYPTAVGERIWVWLVPGLSLGDFESDTDKIAVACWARDCRVGRSKRLAALVWVDVIRTDPLTGSTPLPSPLTEGINSSTFGSTDGSQDGAVVVGAETPLRLVRTDEPLDVPRILIDLAALAEHPATNSSNGSSRNTGSGGRTAARADLRPVSRAATGTGNAAGTDANGSGATAGPEVRGRAGEDVSDWL